MAHYVVFTPGPDYSEDPVDWCWDGTWTWVCDCDTTQPCRWTADCSCERWRGLEISPDGASATHIHHHTDVDEEVRVAMRVDECSIEPWFDEDEKEWALPPRPGKHEVAVTWDWDCPMFAFAEAGA